MVKTEMTGMAIKRMMNAVIIQDVFIFCFHSSLLFSLCVRAGDLGFSIIKRKFYFCLLSMCVGECDCG